MFHLKVKRQEVLRFAKGGMGAGMRRSLGKGKKHGYGRKIATKETIYIGDGQKGVCRERI